MTLKQNTDFKKRFDEYIEKHSRKTEKNKIKTFMKQIRHGLARGADKKTIFNFFRDEKNPDTFLQLFLSVFERIRTRGQYTSGT